MAGSFHHIIDPQDLSFRGTEFIENLGDAYEALEECYYMIMHLTKGNKKTIFEAYRDGYAKKNKLPAGTYKQYWQSEEK